MSVSASFSPRSALDARDPAKEPADPPPDASQGARGVFAALDAHLAQVHPAQPSCRELGEVALAHAASALSAALALRAGLTVSDSDCRAALLDVLGFEGPSGECQFCQALCELEARATRS